MISRDSLNSIPLPEYTEGNYTVVKHVKAIEIIENCLQYEDLSILKEHFQLSKGGNACQGNLYLSYSIDDESDCLITFINSYDKSIAFRINAALRMRESGNMFILNNSIYGNYKRVHKGKANEDITAHLCTKLQHLKSDFTSLLQQKDQLKNILLNDNDVLVLMGDLFFNKDILTSEQVNYVKKELKNPTYTYNCSTWSAFHFYMLCSLAFQHRGSQVHKIYNQQRDLHDYFIDKYKILVTGQQLVLEYDDE